MGYLNLTKEGAGETDIRKHLSQGSRATTTNRISESLLDIGKELTARKSKTWRHWSDLALSRNRLRGAGNGGTS